MQEAWRSPQTVIWNHDRVHLACFPPLSLALPLVRIKILLLLLFRLNDFLVVCGEKASSIAIHFARVTLNFKNFPVKVRSTLSQSIAFWCSDQYYLLCYCIESLVLGLQGFQALPNTGINDLGQSVRFALG